jgi:glutamate racemase
MRTFLASKDIDMLVEACNTASPMRSPPCRKNFTSL